MPHMPRATDTTTSHGAQDLTIPAPVSARRLGWKLREVDLYTAGSAGCVFHAAALQVADKTLTKRV
jgi:hypothetical protein